MPFKVTRVNSHLRDLEIYSTRLGVASVAAARGVIRPVPQQRCHGKVSGSLTLSQSSSVRVHRPPQFFSVATMAITPSGVGQDIQDTAVTLLVSTSANSSASCMTPSLRDLPCNGYFDLETLFLWACFWSISKVPALRYTNADLKIK